MNKVAQLARWCLLVDAVTKVTGGGGSDVTRCCKQKRARPTPPPVCATTQCSRISTSISMSTATISDAAAAAAAAARWLLMATVRPRHHDAHNQSDRRSILAVLRRLAYLHCSLRRDDPQAMPRAEGRGCRPAFCHAVMRLRLAICISEINFLVFLINEYWLIGWLIHWFIDWNARRRSLICRWT